MPYLVVDGVPEVFALLSALTPAAPPASLKDEAILAVWFPDTTATSVEIPTRILDRKTTDKYTWVKPEPQIYAIRTGEAGKGGNTEITVRWTDTANKKHVVDIPITPNTFQAGQITHFVMTQNPNAPAYISNEQVWPANAEAQLPDEAGPLKGLVGKLKKTPRGIVNGGIKKLIDADKRLIDAATKAAEATQKVEQVVEAVFAGLLTGDVFDDVSFSDFGGKDARKLDTILVNVNGILNTTEDAQALLDNASKAFKVGKNDKTMLYNPTHGIPIDQKSELFTKKYNDTSLRSIFPGAWGDVNQIVLNEFGVVDITAYRLKKQLEKASSRLNPGGKIIVVAHSQGTMVF
jgi:hypothetical protein